MGLMTKRTAPTAPSPERTRLAAAIDRLRGLEQQRERAEHAGREASEAIWAAKARVEAATRAVSEARSATARHAVDVALGGVIEAPRSLAEASSELAAAEAALVEAREFQAGLKVRIAELVADTPMARMRLDDAVAVVLKVEAAETVTRLAEEIAELHRAICDKGGALEALASGGAIETSNGFSNGLIVDRAISRALTVATNARLGCGLTERPAEGETARRWREALAALREDAEVALPR